MFYEHEDLFFHLCRFPSQSHLLHDTISEDCTQLRYCSRVTQAKLPGKKWTWKEKRYRNVEKKKQSNVRLAISATDGWVSLGISKGGDGGAAAEDISRKPQWVSVWAGPGKRPCSDERRVQFCSKREKQQKARETWALKFEICCEQHINCPRRVHLYSSKMWKTGRPVDGGRLCCLSPLLLLLSSTNEPFIRLFAAWLAFPWLAFLLKLYDAKRGERSKDSRGRMLSCCCCCCRKKDGRKNRKTNLLSTRRWQQPFDLVWRKCPGHFDGSLASTGRHKSTTLKEYMVCPIFQLDSQSARCGDVFSNFAALLVEMI